MPPPPKLTPDARWNLAAVAMGVRPGWLCSPGEAPRAAVEAEARRLGLHVSRDLVATDGGHGAIDAGQAMPVGFLVTRRPSGAPADGRVTHGWVGRKLGLPCVSDAPWAAPQTDGAFAVLAINPTGMALQAEPHRRARWWVVRTAGTTLTTFWCASVDEAQAWWRALAGTRREGGSLLARPRFKRTPSTHARRGALVGNVLLAQERDARAVHEHP